MLRKLQPVKTVRGVKMIEGYFNEQKGYLASSVIKETA